MVDVRNVVYLVALTGLAVSLCLPWATLKESGELSEGDDPGFFQPVPWLIVGLFLLVRVGMRMGDRVVEWGAATACLGMTVVACVSPGLLFVGYTPEHPEYGAASGAYVAVAAAMACFGTTLWDAWQRRAATTAAA